MWNDSKLSNILPNLPFLKSTKFDRRKIQKWLELLSKTVDDVWKTTSKFNLTIYQENLNGWPLSGDIRDLDDMIIILLPEEIVQKHKDELDNIELPTVKHEEKDKYHNLFKDWKDSGPSPLQNKDFPEEMFETAINTSNAGTTSVHDFLITHKELEQPST